MTDPGVELSVVVVSWNSGPALGACLESVAAAAEGMTAEVWLVDNASGDGAAGRAARDFADVRLIENGENLGFARAANQALERASGAFALLLNPDGQITRTALDRMLGVMAGDPRVGIAGCPSVSGDGSRAPGHEMSFPGRRGHPVAQGDGLGRDVAWVSGACLLARREMMEQIGLLDEGFFMYYEDVDWCHRAREAGWRVVAVPEANIRHELGGSSALVSPAESARRAAASRLRFYGKHYPGLRYQWLRLGMIASALWGAGRRAPSSLFSEAARQAAASDYARLRAALGEPPTGGRKVG